MLKVLCAQSLMLQLLASFHGLQGYVQSCGHSPLPNKPQMFCLFYFRAVVSLETDTIISWVECELHRPPCRRSLPSSCQGRLNRLRVLIFTVLDPVRGPPSSMDACVGGQVHCGASLQHRLYKRISKGAVRTPSVSSGSRRYDLFARKPANLPNTGIWKDCNLTCFDPTIYIRHHNARFFSFVGYVVWKFSDIDE